ncbi:MAG: hypothetical protein ACOYM3_34040 [Terrimicrobiaceae bacterium]
MIDERHSYGHRRLKQQLFRHRPLRTHGDQLAHDPPSIERLAGYWSRVNRAYGLNEQARAFAVEAGPKLDDRPALDALADLEDWIIRGGQD